MNDWIKYIRIEDLELDQKNKELAEILGIEIYLNFVKTYQGSRLYINMYDEVLKVARDKMIRREYNRYNVKYLAKKYNLSEERVRQIVKDLGIEGQISMFD